MATTPGLTKLHRVLEEKDGVMQAISGFLRAERLDTKRRPVLESLKWCSAALLMVAAPLIVLMGCGSGELSVESHDQSVFEVPFPTDGRLIGVTKRCGAGREGGSEVAKPQAGSPQVRAYRASKPPIFGGILPWNCR